MGFAHIFNDIWHPHMQMTLENQLIGIYILFKYFACVRYCYNGWIGYRRNSGIPFVLRQNI